MVKISRAFENGPKTAFFVPTYPPCTKTIFCTFPGPSGPVRGRGGPGRWGWVSVSCLHVLLGSRGGLGSFPGVLRVFLVGFWVCGWWLHGGYIDHFCDFPGPSGPVRGRGGPGRWGWVNVSCLHVLLGSRGGLGSLRVFPGVVQPTRPGLSGISLSPGTVKCHFKGVPVPWGLTARGPFWFLMAWGMRGSCLWVSMHTVRVICPV